MILPFPSVHENLRLMAQQADLPQPDDLDATGYTVDTKGLIPGMVRVYSPCGCVLVASQTLGSMLTPCGKPECEFSFNRVAEAVRGPETGGSDATPDVPELQQTTYGEL